MIPAPCSNCRLTARCQDAAEMLHKALVAWAHDVVAPSCGKSLPRAERGCLED